MPDGRWWGEFRLTADGGFRLQREHFYLAWYCTHLKRERKDSTVKITLPAKRMQQSSQQAELCLFTLKFSGDTVTPACPRRPGSSAPSGTWRLKTCNSEEKKRKSSARARASPRHIRRPTPNGMKYSGLTTWPSALRNLSGLNTSGSFHKAGSMWTAWISGITWVPLGTVWPLSCVVLCNKSWNINKRPQRICKNDWRIGAGSGHTSMCSELYPAGRQ